MGVGTLILGTAGHIDHGKTALIRALTGVDTDRLPEERKRGITIDLGFAPLVLDGVGTVGVVDVPGHEALVRNMLAGATGMDAVLLTIAADEGVMPQTREHLAILSLLNVKHGVVAITKADLVEPAWIELVVEEVRSLCQRSSLGNVDIVPVSSHTGQGIEQLRRALGTVFSGIDRTSLRDDHFRLPVDRVFTVRGTGTVVTGSVWSGVLARDAEVRVLPGGLTCRVKALQAHNALVDSVGPGQRAAVALTGADRSALKRGAVLLCGQGWRATSVIRAEVTFLPDVDYHPTDRKTIHFHLGTAEVPGRVVGSARGNAVRIVLDEPTVARANDRFVLRDPARGITVGGGIVVDPNPEHGRPRALAYSADWLIHLQALLQEARTAGIPLEALPVRTGLGASDARIAPGGLGHASGGTVQVIGDHAFLLQVVVDIRSSVLQELARYHAEQPLEAGMPIALLRSRYEQQGPALLEWVLDNLKEDGAVDRREAVICQKGWQPVVSSAERDQSAALCRRIQAAGREPPAVVELSNGNEGSVRGLLRLLVADGSLTQVEADRYYSTEVLAEMVRALREWAAAGREYSPAEFREVLGVSRKFLIPLLEYFDRVAVTERRQGGRVVKKA